jgi:hypothetical protein
VLTRLDPGERTTVDELAREIGQEHCDAAEVDTTVRRRIEISLVHNHLPRLADHGVITYVPEERGVVLTDDVEMLRTLTASIDRYGTDS